MNMNSQYQLLKDNNLKLNNVCTPRFFRLSNDGDKNNFNELIGSASVFLHDEIYDQLKELIKSRNPTVIINPDEYQSRIEQHLKGCPSDDYGVWVYYPWSHRMVHLLDEEEFIELRTSANKNKITIAERNLLATKKVGVIGLSVGQSVSATLALERGCGELRIADFDTLELNNLNRIRTGVHNLGLLKAHSVAREIAEIDPFFKVVCFTKGITEENIDSFFLDGGKLDAVIDECDGVNIKILCRIKAKELHVPVLMEASDKGTLDVERFDLHPGMPIMHGWLEHLTLDFNVLKNLKTNEEKVPYMLPISGLETLSPRMKASVIEMRSTITTWPQLATAVTLGGGLAADTCRRIFLDQFTDSGRYFLDLEALVPDTRAKTTYAPENQHPPLTGPAMHEIAGKALAELPDAVFSPAREAIEDLVGAAIKAPSAGNSQPWKWYSVQGYLFLFYEDTGIVSFGDFEQIASNIAHGAALENLQLTAHARGIGVHVRLFPLVDDRRLVAAIGFEQEAKPADTPQPDLVDFIDHRQTNRNAGNKQEIPKHILEHFDNAVRSVPGANLIVRDLPADIGILSGIIGPAERIKLLNPASHFEFFQKEMRWSEEEGSTQKDGISINELGISQQEKIMLKMVKSPETVKLLADWRGGHALEYTARKSVATASAFGLITMPGSSPVDYTSGGRAMQRLWLTAAKYGIAIQPMMTAPLVFERMDRNSENALPEMFREEYTRLYQQFSGLFPGLENKGKIFLFKMGFAEKSIAKSQRKPVHEVLLFAESKSRNDRATIEIGYTE
jgi:ThiF family protein